MALSQLSEKTIYLSVADGSIIRQHKEATEFTKERVTKTGKLVHEQKYKDLSGILVSVQTRENDFGKQWSLKFKDGEDVYIINLPYSSRYSSDFLKKLPNIDLSNVVKFAPYSFADKQTQKQITGITLYQNGNKVESAYTKDNPNGLPQMKQIKVKGVTTWDDTDMMEFLEQKTASLFSNQSTANDIAEDETPF